MADGSIFRQPAPCGENPHGPMDTWKDLVEIQIFFFGISVSVQSFWPRARIISLVISTIFCKIHLISINPTIQRLPLIPIYWYCTCKIERQNLGSYFKTHTPNIEILDPSIVIFLWPKDIPISNLALTFDQNLLVMTAAVSLSAFEKWSLQVIKTPGCCFSLRGLYIILSSYITKMQGGWVFLGDYIIQVYREYEKPLGLDP